MIRHYQTRLSPIQDNIRRKLIDNTIAHEGMVIDTIRIRAQTNREGDPEQYYIESAEIIPVIFSPMQDVPMREILKSKTTDEGYIITSLISAVASGDQGAVPDHYLVQTRRQDKVYVGDLLFRVFQEPERECPSVLGLEILEALATIGANSVISNNYQVGIYTKIIPPKIQNVIIEMAKRRLYLQF